MEHKRDWLGLGKMEPYYCGPSKIKVDEMGNITLCEDFSNRFKLKVHPNGQYWKIIDIRNGEEFAKESAVKLLNNMNDENELLNKLYSIADKQLNDIFRIFDEPIYLVENVEKLWDCSEDFNVKKYTFYDLLINQSNRIMELEQTVMDLEWEVEQLSDENLSFRERL